MLVFPIIEDIIIHYRRFLLGSWTHIFRIVAILVFPGLQDFGAVHERHGILFYRFAVSISCRVACDIDGISRNSRDFWQPVTEGICHAIFRCAGRIGRDNDFRTFRSVRILFFAQHLAIVIDELDRIDIGR